MAIIEKERQQTAQKFVQYWKMKPKETSVAKPRHFGTHSCTMY